MENKKTLKLIWIGSGIIIFGSVVNLYVKVLQSGQMDETNPARSLLEPVISGTTILIIYGIIGLIYVLLNKYKTFIKKIWAIFGFSIYVFNLIPWLLLVLLFKSEIGSKNSDVGGLAVAFFIGGWIQFGIWIIIVYILTTILYFIFKKIVRKTQ